MQYFHRFLPTCLALFLSTACPFVFAHETVSVAHVLDLKGNWRVTGQGPQAKAGQALYAGTEVVVEGAVNGDFITIVRDSDLTRQRIVCPNECHRPIRIRPDPAVRSAGIQQLLKVAMDLLLDKPPALANAYATPMSRGRDLTVVEDLAPFDPVLGTSLAKTLPALPAGDYTVNVIAVGQDQQTISQSLTLSENGNWQLLQISSPGLYQLYIADAEQTEVANVLLLLTPRSEYSEKRRAFDAMKSRASTWEGPSGRADKHRLLRAVLVELGR
jgi:hypothetical protein